MPAFSLVPHHLILLQLFGSWRKRPSFHKLCNGQSSRCSLVGNEQCICFIVSPFFLLSSFATWLREGSLQPRCICETLGDDSNICQMIQLPELNGLRSRVVAVTISACPRSTGAEPRHLAPPPRMVDQAPVANWFNSPLPFNENATKMFFTTCY